MKKLKHPLACTLLAALVFFSVSFISLLSQIAPLHYFRNGDPYRLEIGFPFSYYRQFFVSGNGSPNFGWNVNYLFFDISLTLAVVALPYWYWLYRRRKSCPVKIVRK